MDTQSLIEMLTREVLKEIAKKGEENLSDDSKGSQEKVLTAFLGDDEVLKDELKKDMPVLDNIELDSSWKEIGQNYSKKRLVVSNLCINSLIELAQGRKNVITECLFDDGEVIVVEEGMEYRNYSRPAGLMELYDEYAQKIKSFGINIIKRTEVRNALDIKGKVYMKGLITADRLISSGIKDQVLAVDGKSKITSLAKDYIKENNIEIYYERG